MIHLSEIIKKNQDFKIIGNPDKEINGVIPLDIDNEDEKKMMWVSPKNIESLLSIPKGIIICSQAPSHFYNSTCTYIVVEHPRQAFQKILSDFFVPPAKRGVSKTASIANNVSMGKEVYIGDFVVIEEGCVIGDYTSIDHHTTIKSGTKIGKNVVIGSNNTIGGVGFGYEKDEQGDYIFIPHIGNVLIEDKVEIGNNTCIDRAVLGSTILKENAKIDNLVHIAHGVVVGRNSLVIANAMVAGSVVIGDHTWVAPSSSILNQKKIGNQVTIGLAAVVVKDVPDGQTVIGSPAEEISTHLQKKKNLEKFISSQG